MCRSTVLYLGVCTLTALFVRAVPAQSGTNAPVTFQGVLEDSGVSVIGQKDIALRLYRSETGGVVLENFWFEDEPIDGGLFQLDVPVPFSIVYGDGLWAEIEVEGELLSPRIPFTPTPYALAARAIADPGGESRVYYSGNQLVWEYDPGFATFDRWSISQANVLPGVIGFAVRNLTDGQHPSGSESWVFVDQGTANVGLGVDDPDSSLHAWGDIRSEGAFVNSKVSLERFGSFGQLRLESDLGDTGIILRGGAGPSIRLNIPGTDAGPDPLDLPKAGVDIDLQSLNGPGQVGRVRIFASDGAGGAALATMGVAEPAKSGSPTGQVLVGGADTQGVIRTDIAGIYVDQQGRGVVFGDVKNFRIPHPHDSHKEIWYASVESPEVAVTARGTSRLRGGKAFVELPDHFAAIIDEETITVQLTPRSADTFGLACTSREGLGFRVQELRLGRGDFEFDWVVTARRTGYESFAPVRTID